VKYQILILAIVAFLGIIVFSVMFRYEYMGTRLGFEIRADRWTGCVETWNNKENTYKALDKLCQ
jgi:hypothetical protein